MSKRIVNRTLSAAIVAALYAGSSYAQEPAKSAGSLDEVVVTGSYIRGTPEDSALPVDVVTAEDLADQGSPTVVQFVKTITAATSSIGEANRHLGGAGTAQINLRGLGAARTLTLFNNRRMADNAVLVGGLQAGGANLNFIPEAAIARVEVLKDGAAATYGSDAVAGVVNFITRTDLDGVEVDAQYAAISDSDGDYQASVAWGTKLDNGNVLVSFGYRHRSAIDIRDRDWALKPFESAAWGGWSGGGNPGQYVSATTPASTTFFRDNGCTELGGYLDGATCRFRFSTFVDLVNEEDHYQFHAEFNSKVGDDVNAHAELTWARDWVPVQRITPSNTTAAFPTSLTSDSLQAPAFINGGIRYNVPAYAPGLQDLISTCALSPVTFQGANTCATLSAAGSLTNPLARGVDASPTSWRAIAHAGHPTNPDFSDHQSIESKAFRFVTGLNGDVGSVHWDTAITYMASTAAVNSNDLLVNRIQEGLNGYLSLPGSADPCSSADRASLEALGNNQPNAGASHANLGCYFFNPFTNSVAVSATNGQANPLYRGSVNPAVVNDPRVMESMYGHYENVTTSNLAVFDAVFSGTTGLKLFSDDEMGWALGGQYRHTQDKAEYGDLFNNQITQCVDSIDGGIRSPSCTAPNGPLEFFGSAKNFDVTRGVYAAFGELSLPITESLSASLAARYESYPGNIGSTFDPKLQAKYQIIDWLALRGSVGSTFRAPNPTTVGPNCTTGVANINNTYRAVQTCANPDLEPETAQTYNFGILLNPGDFTFSLDYYQFKFEGELTNESAARMHAQAVAGGCASPAELLARFQLAGPCSAATLANPTLMRTYYINGPDTNTSGIDVRMQYDWSKLSAGIDATYIIEYDRGDTFLKDSPTTLIAPAEDRAGHHDLTSSFFSYPEIKGNLFVAYRLEAWNFRLQTRYSKGTTGSPGLGIPTTVPIDDYWQHDLIARWSAPMGVTVMLSVQNVLDTDPPAAPSFYNYDYLTGNALGRVFEIGAKVKF